MNTTPGIPPALAEVQLPANQQVRDSWPRAGMLPPFWPSRNIVPATIGELPSHSFQVKPDTEAASIVAELERNPELPGVLIVENHRCLGMVSRQKCFEQLGRPFGIEVFLNRPIITLHEAIQYNLTVMPAHTRIDAALQTALSRPMEHRYEPIVVQRVDQRFQVLDLHILLMAESRLLANANRLIRKQVLIGQVLSSSRPAHEVLGLILEHLDSVMPFNRGGLVLHHGNTLDYIAQRGFPASTTCHQLRLSVNENDIYAWLRQNKQPLYEPDVTSGQRWKYLTHFPTTRTWLAVPLLQGGAVTGMLFAMRVFANSPYTADDVEIAEAFAAQASLALHSAQLQADQRALEAKQRELDRYQVPAWGRLRRELNQVLTTLTDLAQAMLEVPVDALTAPMRQHFMGLQASGQNLRNLLAQLPPANETDET